ncbi:MAG: glycosyltransferase family 2 protein [Propionivibrio sp.]|uniref:Glycosyltransferase family 2 protein n=1 Tax=Candidatus Propionivibrio dominans TaxID=2954373 RepID=A0A9D7FF30_9RHOO|nr:glycosyltransferase family 2 protein [Candidatus Propionivibrio dominans]MBL0167321.1 glycosyltransferase family 2 protein [Propionivibrio sp.]
MNSSASTNLTILIVTWNSWGDLKRCLESIRKVGAEEHEVLVFDNGSIDGTVDKLRQQFPDIRLEQSPTNLGLPPAVNRGLRAARGDYVMLLDVDTEVKAGTVSRLLDFMRQRPDISLVAPRIYTPEGAIEPSARNLPSAMNGLFGRQSFLTRLFPNNPYSRRYLATEHISRKDPFQVSQVSAACMFMRRSLIDEVGPWDEGYRCYWVDSDWCAQLKRAGKAIYCVPDVGIVHHENNRAGKKKSVWRICHFHIGAYRLYRKHYTRGVLDPRALFAALALFIRTGVMLVLNEFKSSTETRMPAEGRRPV